MNTSKQIGLITIHHANSYGGVLQAYATKSILRKYGAVRIVDYKSDHLQKTLEPIRLFDGPRGLLRAAKDVARYFPRTRLIRKFNRFCRTHLDVGEELTDRAFDVAVAGSDQIWNPRVTSGLEEKYFLSGIRARKRVSFSTSTGSYRYSPAEARQVRDWLKDFSSIAVREADTANYLATLLERDVSQTVDPTLLLDADDWRSVMGVKCIDYPYILVYSLKESNLLRQVISKVVRNTRMRVVTINQNPWARYRADSHIRDAGPEEYLSLFANASLVITNSFHGTAFACNFSVPFISVKPEHGSNRIAGLLSQVGASGRMVNQFDDIDPVLKAEIRWDHVTSSIARLRGEARSYLDAAVGL